MKRIIVIAALFSLGVIAGCTDPNAPVEPDPSFPSTTSLNKQRPDDKSEYDGYIVVLENSVSAEEVESIAQELGSKHKGSVDKRFKRAVKGFSMKLSKNDLDNLKKDRRVKFIEPDYLIEAEPFGKGGKSESNGKKPRKESTTPTEPTEPSQPTTGDITPWGVTRIGGARDATGKTAWIVDSGIDFEHPDLNVDIVRSRNFVPDGQSADDVYGHGTHVAGTVGARNDGKGVIGVAANATLVSIRVLGNSGGGSYSYLIAGLDYIAQHAHAGDVVNLSLGGPGSDAVDAAVLRLAAMGVRIAIAAGNKSQDAIWMSPARVSHANVYTVSACDKNNYFASWSNYGNPPIDFAAPGVGILSTIIGGGTGTKSGTSMAAPHVAGLLLLNSIQADGMVRNDPDGQADPIAHY